MKRLCCVPLLLTVVLGCGDSTSPTNTLRNTVSPDLGSMIVGQVRVLTFAQATSGLTIPDSLSSAEYVIVAANVKGDSGPVPQYTITGDRQGPPIASGTRNLAPSPLMHPMFTRVGGKRGAQFEAKLRSYERSRWRRSISRTRTVSPRLRADNVPFGTVPTVGQQFQFNVPNGNDLCVDYATVTATVKAVSAHAIIVTDNEALNDGFTQATYDSVASEFDAYTYPTEAGYFGAPTDIDGNGRVFILYTPVVNRLTPPGAAATTGFVGGFTFIGDFFPATSDGCLGSNQGEIFYLMVPDPTGALYGNAFPVSFVEEQTRVTMAHEFQHAINAGNRFVSGASSAESAWLDEALSSMAEDNVGRAELGYSDLQTLTLSTVRTMIRTNDTTLLNTFFLTNFARTQLYVTRPDTIGPIITDNRIESDVAGFGAGWAFLRYTADWVSNTTPRPFTRALVAGPDTGTTNLTLHAGASLDTLLAHWLVTMYTDGQNIPGLPAQYNYRSYNLRGIVSDLCFDLSCANTYLPVTAIGTGTASITLGVPSSSADYFITSQTNGGARTIKIANSGTSTPATNPSGRLYVIRVQ